MSIVIPDANYVFPQGGIAIRKLAKQALISSADHGIVYLPGGNAAQPISPSYGSWDDTSYASRLKGYIAYDLTQKLGQGGNSTLGEIQMFYGENTGSHSQSCLLSQHVIQIPTLFKPKSSLRGAGIIGAFELANRAIGLTGNSSYPGCVGITLGGRSILYNYVSGDAIADPNGHRDTGNVKLRILTRLVDHNGTTVGSTTTYSSLPNITGHLSFQGLTLVPTPFVSDAYTSPNDRLACYLVVEVGFTLTYSTNDFTFTSGGHSAVWYCADIIQDVTIGLDDTQDNLMEGPDTNQFSTYFCLFALTSALSSDASTQLLGASR